LDAGFIREAVIVHVVAPVTALRLDGDITAVSAINGNSS
jgi:hypothetical protein